MGTIILIILAIAFFCVLIFGCGNGNVDPESIREIMSLLGL